ncbi:type II 3-dehydroquinate dehydratase [Yaniella flava]|uniref:3-dehydroquinate dehydratase n=1 Tax=Yaniella flava TaxID=287930 RepID=A0ABN2UR76_9MICC|nr:type II 3-dehydroquinate dehydratase [Micrococcaceae bacterium]
MTTVYVLNGPNLNLLGLRDPNTYGTQTLADVQERCDVVAKESGLELIFRQSNHEGELIDWLHEAGRAVADGTSAGVVLNAGAYTHTSVGLADAISGAFVPTIEVHISNVHARESFRHHSYISPVAAGVIVGLGTYGYDAAIQALAHRENS